MSSGDRFDKDADCSANLDDLRRLFWLRNVAISGQAVAVFAARKFLRVTIPLAPNPPRWMVSLPRSLA